MRNNFIDCNYLSTKINVKYKINRKNKYNKKNNEFTKTPQVSNPGLTTQEQVYSNYILSYKNYFLVAKTVVVIIDKRRIDENNYLLFMAIFKFFFKVKKYL